MKSLKINNNDNSNNASNLKENGNEEEYLN